MTSVQNMRCFGHAAAIAASTIILCGCTASTPLSPSTGLSAAANTSDAYERAKQGGCIGKLLDVCLTNLQVGFQLRPNQNIADSIRRNDAVDVAGKRVSQKNTLSVSGHLKGWDEQLRTQAVDLTYSEDKVVNYIEIFLPSDPALANTEDEYRKTGLYEGMVLLLGSACPTIERTEVYKFFQTTVKPKIVREGKKIEIHDTSAETQNFAKAPDIPFCGQRFTYTNLFGVDTNYVSETNSSGLYYWTAISFNTDANSQKQPRRIQR